METSASKFSGRVVAPGKRRLAARVGMGAGADRTCAIAKRNDSRWGAAGRACVSRSDTCGSDMGGKGEAIGTGAGSAGTS
ncbi:MAG: hypothetical protein KGL09_09285, partial [Pseudomonadota bacterium]|nr:hypothetical protein [Pseudomonadota bacterium]